MDFIIRNAALCSVLTKKNIMKLLPKAFGILAIAFYATGLYTGFARPFKPATNDLLLITQFIGGLFCTGILLLIDKTNP